jgi:hypothetical protein
MPADLRSGRRRTMNTLSRNGGLWIALGTAAGVLIGVAFGMASVGLALGLVLGIAGGFIARR